MRRFAGSALCGFVTSRPGPDGGVIADFTGEFDDPGVLAARLSATVGVVEHGLFPASMVAKVVVARGEQVEIREVH